MSSAAQMRASEESDTERELALELADEAAGQPGRLRQGRDRHAAFEAKGAQALADGVSVACFADRGQA